MQMSNSGRPCALVTGASSGLGMAFAERLAGDGCDLIVVARRLDRLQDLAKRLEQEHGVRVEILHADLNDAYALSEVEAAIGGNDALTLLINSAGFAGYYPFASVDPKVIDDLIGIHVNAITRTTRAALPGMIRRGRGGIINIAGLLALAVTLPPAPLPPRAVYAGAKAYMLAFTQTLAGELKGTGVRVQVCVPGRIETDFHAVQGLDTSKQPPAMAADEVVAAALTALSHDEVVCIPGLTDPKLWDDVTTAELAVFRAAAMRSTSADRYHYKPEQ